MRPARASLVSSVIATIVVASVALPVAATDPVESFDVSINDQALATNSLAVTVATPFAGAVTMRLSNDGITSKTMAYATSTAWALDDPDAGGTNVPGIKHVYVEWYDGTDTLIGSGSDAIWYDIAPPVESAFGVRIERGRTVSTGGAVPFVVSWLNKDNVGTQRYEADSSTDGGAWVHVDSHAGAPGFRHGFAAGHTYRVRARGVDYAGNASAWLTGPSFTVSRYQESSTRLTWTGTWSRLASASYWGGAEKTTTRAGSTAKLTFTGRRVVLVTRVGPNRGVVAIYVNGAKVATVDLWASTAANRRVVWEKSWSTSASRTVLVKLIREPGRSTRADIDAFVTGN